MPYHFQLRQEPNKQLLQVRECNLDLGLHTVLIDSITIIDKKNKIQYIIGYHNLYHRNIK